MLNGNKRDNALDLHNLGDITCTGGEAIQGDGEVIPSGKDVKLVDGEGSLVGGELKPLGDLVVEGEVGIEGDSKVLSEFCLERSEDEGSGVPVAF